MQQKSNRDIGVEWDQKVRSYGPDAGFAFQDRNGQNDWEWYSDEETARLAYGGGGKRIFHTSPKAKLQVKGDLEVENSAT